jgi:hypothetical protein
MGIIIGAAIECEACFVRLHDLNQFYKGVENVHQVEKIKYFGGLSGSHHAVGGLCACSGPGDSSSGHLCAGPDHSAYSHGGNRYAFGHGRYCNASNGYASYFYAGYYGCRTGYGIGGYSNGWFERFHRGIYRG